MLYFSDPLLDVFLLVDILQAVCFAGEGGLIVNISYRFIVSSLGLGGSELA